jgi:uncharacterized membrane protein YfcA
LSDVTENNYPSLFIFFLLALLSEILGTLSGFGSSIFTVSLLQFLFTFQSVLMVTSILHVFSNAFKVILFRKTIDWKIALWLGVSSILLSIGGANAINYVRFDYVKMFLGIFLIALSSFFYFDRFFKLSATLKNSVIAGGVAGFMAGFVGTGGAIRGLALTAFNLEKSFYVGTSSAIDFGVDAGRASVYWLNNYFTTDLIPYVPVTAAAAFLGSYFGKKILGKISQENFRKIVLVLIFATGLLMIIQNLLHEFHVLS